MFASIDNRPAVAFLYCIYPQVLAEQGSNSELRQHATLWCDNEEEALRIARAESEHTGLPHSAYLCPPADGTLLFAYSPSIRIRSDEAPRVALRLNYLKRAYDI